MKFYRRWKQRRAFARKKRAVYREYKRKGGPAMYRIKDDAWFDLMYQIHGFEVISVGRFFDMVEQYLVKRGF